MFSVIKGRIFFKKCNSMLTTSRCYSTERREWAEVRIPVPWGFVAGKWWGPQNVRPILAVHGWQDNSGTFDRLIPYLPPHIPILAVDFPGHGRSSWIPQGIFYHGMGGPILLKQLLGYFGWERIALLGHSMGAITNYIYTILYPETVDFLINIDGIKPLVLPNNTAVIVKSINKFLKYEHMLKSNRAQPSYSMDELKQRLYTGSRKSVLPENAQYILERNISPSKNNPNKYYITRDPRLKTGPLVNWPQEELVENAKRLTSPILLIKVGDKYIEKKEYVDDVLAVVKKSSKDYQYYNVNGTHHVHLNTPEVIEGYVNDFIKKHYVENKIDDDTVIKKIAYSP